MARLIVKSPYIKCGNGGEGAGGYLKYIGTREGVEFVPDDRPPTRRQEQMITRLTKDFPDTLSLDEYADYAERKTKYHASAFITQALEENWEQVNEMDVYAKYIATRPRAERLGAHGLFGDEDSVDLDAVMDELQNYEGNVWTHIISLHREDAVRLGYDNAAAWRDLLRAHRNDIAAAMKIPPQDFRWCAAFHDEGHHPHVHMMAWSAVPGHAYLSREGIRQIKSQLMNHIFAQDMLHTYEQKSQSRDELVREARQAMTEMVRKMKNGIADHPEVERLIADLAAQLPTTGKLSYGYLPKKQKRLVDEIVDEMERLPIVHDCYEKWCELQWQVESYYNDKPKEKRRLSEQKEFRQIKNAVIRAAEQIRVGIPTFEDRDLREHDEPDEFQRSTYYFEHLHRSILNEDAPIEQRDEAVQEMVYLADTGDLYAGYFVGKLYRDGGLLLPDVELAVKYFERAAVHGLIAAQYALGKLLLDDEEVRNPTEGIRWLEQAAEYGHSYAAYRLGKEYLKGKVIPKDAEKAAVYLAQAADAGNQWAQYMLGKLYLAGDDIAQAQHYLTLAADQGNRYAQYFLDRMDDPKPPSVMLAATRLLHHLGNIFRDNTPKPTSSVGMRIDRKRLQQLREKKMAMGHKPDDHEEQQQGYGGMQAPW